MQDVNNLATMFLYSRFILHNQNMGISAEYMCSYCYANQFIVFIKKWIHTK